MKGSVTDNTLLATVDLFAALSDDCFEPLALQ